MHLREDWDQPQYYFPTYENDNLLFGLEDPGGGPVVPLVTPEEVRSIISLMSLILREVGREGNEACRGPKEVS